MTKLYFTIVCLIFTVTVFSQNKENTTYSESIPYQPTIFLNKKEEKKKEDKKKKEKNENEQKQNEVAVPTPPVTVSTQFEMPVYVYDKKGIVVNDLKKEDFTLFVDDKEQTIEKVEIESRPLNIILLLDDSSSTAIQDKKVYENIAFQISERLVPQNYIKIVEFSDKIKVLCEFTKNLEDCKKNNEKIKLDGGTAIYDSIETISKEIIQKSEQTIILVLTDGIDTVSVKSTYRNSLIFTERSKATVFPLYLDLPPNLLSTTAKPTGLFGQQILGSTITGGSTKTEIEKGKQYLRDITVLSGGRMFELKKPNELGNGDFDFISRTIKPHYSLSFNFSDSINADRRIQIKLRVNRPNLLVRTRGSRIISTPKN